MSYRIEYDRGAGKYEVKEKATLFPWIATVIGIIMLMALYWQPKMLPSLKEALIQGEDALTMQAFSTMTADLRSGATISDAVEAFCKTVIHGS